MTLPLKLAQIHPQQWMINSEGPAQGISDAAEHQQGWTFSQRYQNS